MTGLFRAISNYWGRLSGLAGCRRCGDSFEWKPFHITIYEVRVDVTAKGIGGGSSNGCFPLCEDCWSELTPEQRVPYYEQLADVWRQGGAEPSKCDAIVQAALDGR